MMRRSNKSPFAFPLPVTWFSAPLTILFVISLAIRIYYVAAYSFDGLYGQDAFAYFNQATAILNDLPRGQLPPLDFFWPNGYPFLGAFFMALMGKTEFAVLLSALLTGAAIAPIVYLLCRELFKVFGHRAGWIAGLVIAVAGQPVLSSVTSMADMPALFWATLATWSLVRAWNFRRVPDNALEPSNRMATHHRKWETWLALAGLFLGFATITRWVYALLALPFAGYALFQTRKNRTAFWPLALPFIAGLVPILPQLWLSSHQPEGMFHPWLVGWSPVNFFSQTFQTPDGLLNFERPVALFNLIPLIHPAYLFVFGVAALPGAWRLGQEKEWGVLILLGGWGGLMYLFLAGIPYENFRFALSFFPPLVMLAGFGTARLMENFSQVLKPKLVEIGCLVGIGASLICMLVWAHGMVGAFLDTQNAKKAQVLEIATKLPARAAVITMGPTLIFQHYTDIRATEYFSLDEIKLSTLLETNSELYLLLDISDLEGRWRGMDPHRNYLWLLENTTFVKVDSFPPYSLFEVQRNP